MIFQAPLKVWNQSDGTGRLHCIISPLNQRTWLEYLYHTHQPQFISRILNTLRRTLTSCALHVIESLITLGILRHWSSGSWQPLPRRRRRQRIHYDDRGKTGRSGGASWHWPRPQIFPVWRVEGNLLFLVTPSMETALDIRQVKILFTPSCRRHYSR